MANPPSKAGLSEPSENNRFAQMLLEQINLELRVLSQADAAAVLRDQPGRWSVISILSAREERIIDLRLARESVRLVFDDVVVDDPGRGILGPQAAHAREIVANAERFAGHPLLIHCQMGFSRSPAAALGVLLLHARRHKVADPMEFALESLLQLGTFQPNPRLVRFMVEAVAPDEPRTLQRMFQHPLWRRLSKPDFYSRFLPRTQKAVE